MKRVLALVLALIMALISALGITRDADGNHIEKRPDRVITDGNETIVIDYKTGKKSDEHVRQVQTYMHLLTTMGYPNVHGSLWYIRQHEIKAIWQSHSEKNEK